MQQATRYICGFLFLALLSTSICVKATTPHHSLEDIRLTARDFVLSTLPDQSYEYTVLTDKLDPRLRLSRCQIPLEAWYPQQGRRAGNITVGIRCTDERPWSIYVPVSVNYFAEVVVANRPLQRGAIITAEDVRLERKNLSFRADNHISSIEEVIGRELVHSLQLGHVLSNRNLKLPVIIKRGQRVTLLARTDSFEVQMEGEAMMDGVAGQYIKVRNSRSKRVIQGQVKSSNIIYIE
ncbi:MAG: flagellar basal body P-ring formation protein FlgA [Thiotrichales bacterium]|nr:flagellar basal body P-ring formation protein FlgA [Thiotrichales bacterium]